MDKITPELLNISLSFLRFILVVIPLIKFYKPIRYELLPELSGIKAMGVEFSFIEYSIDAAIEFGEKNERWKIKVPEEKKNTALTRVRRHLEIFIGIPGFFWYNQ